MPPTLWNTGLTLATSGEAWVTALAAIVMAVLALTVSLKSSRRGHQD